MSDAAVRLSQGIQPSVRIPAAVVRSVAWTTADKKFFHREASLDQWLVDDRPEGIAQEAAPFLTPMLHSWVAHHPTVPPQTVPPSGRPYSDGSGAPASRAALVTLCPTTGRANEYPTDWAAAVYRALKV